MALSGKGWKLGMSNRKSYLSWIGINVDNSLIRDQNEFSSQFVKQKASKHISEKAGNRTLEFVQVKYKTGPCNSEFNRFNSVSQKAGVIQKRSYHAIIYLLQVNQN